MSQDKTFNFLWLNLFLLIYIVNDLDVVNHDNAIVFVTEKNSVMADPRRFYIALPQESFMYYLELTDLK